MQTILIIEDDRAIRRAIVDILELEGYRALSAEDGVTGVALARQEHPSLIVCDIIMPYLDGYGVLAQLRKHIDTAMIPFIFLTARTTKTDVRQGMNLGADDYLTKPFRPEELIRTIQARLERQARLSEKLQGRVEDLHKSLMRVLPHELNTPLHGILAGIEFLREEYENLEPSDVNELLTIVHQSALRMRRLVSNSLLHADLGRTRANEENSSMNQGSVLVSVVETLELVTNREADAADREADVRLYMEDANLFFSPIYLTKIIEEIVNNAFKYSKHGTPVEITSQRRGEEWWLTVKDYGRGMSDEEIAAIGSYMQFQRAKFEQQGLGLGLVIIQRILDLYHGKMVIESQLGQYTTVTIALPLASAVNSAQV